MAILSFFQDDAFIFVITLATKQRLEVNLELGFVSNIMLDRTVIFSSLIVQRCHFACRKCNLLAIDEVCRQHTYRAPHFLMHSCCTDLFYLMSECAQSHIDPMHLQGSSHEAHCLRFAQKHSHLIAQCRTPCRTRRDHARALLPHLFLSQSSSRADTHLRRSTATVSGAWTEQPHFTGYEPWLAEDRDYM